MQRLIQNTTERCIWMPPTQLKPEKLLLKRTDYP